MKKTMKFIKKIAFTLLVAGAIANANAQDVNDITKSFETYRQQHLQEKLFVHTDKETYLAGELLWFKIYAVAGESNKPLNFSKVAYVDIIDKNKESVLQAKIPMTLQGGNGSLYLPVTLPNGNYRLRAYTSWMKNFSADYFFEKKITIINSLRSPELGVAPFKNEIDAQFFPEGGNLVAGLPVKLAFKVAGSDGKGIDARGAIVDEHHDTVARFKSLKFGIGNFQFTPGANHTYKAAIYTAHGTITKDLPAVSATGYVMSLKPGSGGDLAVSVTSNIANNSTVYLFAHTRQVVKVAKTAVFADGVAHFVINANDLGEGVSHITIFNADKQPVCERLFFKKPTQELALTANPDEQEYARRKKVSIALASKDHDGKPVPADLSVSVYRTDIFQDEESADIKSYLWLSSDLQGNIESPGYYFSSNTAEVDEAVDNLMLSQGWRHFEWKTVLSKTKPSFSYLPEYDSHLVIAKITNAKTNLPAKDIVAYLGVTGKRVQLSTAVSDSTGKLIFNTTDMFGSGEIVVQTNNQVDSIYHIDVQNPFAEQYAKTILPPFVLSAAMQKPLESLNFGVQVQNIYTGDKMRKLYDPAIDSGAFYGKTFTPYKLDDFTRFATMEEVLREYVKNVNVVHTGNNFELKIISRGDYLDGGAPFIMLDGIPIFNINKIVAIDPLKVKKLDLVNEKYIYQATRFEGILSFTTYKGDLGGVELDPKAVVLDYEGLQQQREFYSPMYDDPSQNKRLPDYRNVLYWSPNVATGSNGTGELSFFTSDLPGKYTVIIQGITADGNVGSHSFTFAVKPGYTASIQK